MSAVTRIIAASIVALAMWAPSPSSIVLAEHGGIHALFAKSLDGASAWTQRYEAEPGEELYLVLKSDQTFGPIRVSLGNLPLAVTVVDAGNGPWRTVKLSEESPTDIDALEWDTAQSDAAVLKIRVNETGPGTEFGVEDARLTIDWRAPALAEQPTARQGLAGGLRSDGTNPPPSFVTGLDASYDPGWLVVQCYCWRGEGIAMPTLNLREERGDWSYSWRPDVGHPTVFTDLPQDVGLILELNDRSAVAPGQPTRWDGIYLAEHGAVVYFVLSS